MAGKAPHPEFLDLDLRGAHAGASSAQSGLSKTTEKLITGTPSALTAHEAVLPHVESLDVGITDRNTVVIIPASDSDSNVSKPVGGSCLVDPDTYDM